MCVCIEIRVVINADGNKGFVKFTTAKNRYNRRAVRRYPK